MVLKLFYCGKDTKKMNSLQVLFKKCKNNMDGISVPGILVYEKRSHGYNCDHVTV